LPGETEPVDVQAALPVPARLGHGRRGSRTSPRTCGSRFVDETSLLAGSPPSRAKPLRAAHLASHERLFSPRPLPPGVSAPLLLATLCPSTPEFNISCRTRLGQASSGTQSGYRLCSSKPIRRLGMRKLRFGLELSRLRLA
jgi:hypothetical protein